MERVKRRIFASLSAVALAGGAITAAAPLSSAATTQCGSSCITFAAEEYGSTYVAAIQARLVEQGSLVSLAGSANFKGEDFRSLYEGTTTQLWEDGLVSIALAKNWPSSPMYEYEYYPYGQDSNLCIGTATGNPRGGQRLRALHRRQRHAVNRALRDHRGQPRGALTTHEQVSPALSSQLWEEIAGVL
jgi:hypothetical protein